jgi:Uncharacterised protein family UPF0547
VTAEPPPTYKRCPDCAETVRVEARVCRYCGYRFVSAERPNKAGSADAEPDLLDLLSEWGAGLKREEQVVFFLPARLRLEHARLTGEGFLLVTDDRLVFFVGGSPNLLRQRGVPRVLFERRICELEVTVSGSVRKRAMRLGDGIVVKDIYPRSKLQEIQRYLANSNTRPR